MKKFNLTLLFLLISNVFAQNCNYLYADYFLNSNNLIEVRHYFDGSCFHLDSAQVTVISEKPVTGEKSEKTYSITMPFIANLSGQQSPCSTIMFGKGHLGLSNEILESAEWKEIKITPYFQGKNPPFGTLSIYSGRSTIHGYPQQECFSVKELRKSGEEGIVIKCSSTKEVKITKVQLIKSDGSESRITDTTISCYRVGKFDHTIHLDKDRKVSLENDYDLEIIYEELNKGRVRHKCSKIMLNEENFYLTNWTVHYTDGDASKVLAGSGNFEKKITSYIKNNLTITVYTNLLNNGYFKPKSGYFNYQIKTLDQRITDPEILRNLSKSGDIQIDDNGSCKLELKVKSLPDGIYTISINGYVYRTNNSKVELSTLEIPYYLFSKTHVKGLFSYYMSNGDTTKVKLGYELDNRAVGINDVYLYFQGKRLPCDKSGKYFVFTINPVGNGRTILPLMCLGDTIFEYEFYLMEKSAIVQEVNKKIVERTNIKISDEITPADAGKLKDYLKNDDNKDNLTKELIAVLIGKFRSSGDHSMDSFGDFNAEIGGVINDFIDSLARSTKDEIQKTGFWNTGFGKFLAVAGNFALKFFKIILL